MAELCWTWVTLIFLMSLPRVGHCLPMPDTSGLSPASHRDAALGIGSTPRRWRRERIEAVRENCALLAAPWRENRDGGAWGHQYRLKVLSLPEGGPRRAVFPEQTLFRFVRRVYRCCQMGFHCRGVKGIQGQPSGESEVEFLLSSDVLSASVVRAEIHLQISNPLHLSVEPWLPSLEKHKRPTRYSVWSTDGMVELRVDLLFLFQGLQEAIGGPGRGSSLVDLRRVGGLVRHSGAGLRRGQVDPSPQETDSYLWEGGLSHLPYGLELGLVIQCTKGREAVPCENNGVHLLHTPFIAVSYK